MTWSILNAALCRRKSDLYRTRRSLHPNEAAWPAATHRFEGDELPTEVRFAAGEVDYVAPVVVTDLETASSAPTIRWGGSPLDVRIPSRGRCT